MRLLAITNDFPPTLGGIENYTYSLLRRWAPSDVTVVTRRVPGCEEFDRNLDFEVIRLPVGTLLPTHSLQKRIDEMASSFDVLHFPSALPLGLLRVRRPYAVSVHGGEFMLASKLPLARQALRRVLGRAAVILPQSSFASNIVERFLHGPPPIVRVTCGVDIERYNPGPRTPGANLVSVSRLVARKGPATLIRAMPAILARHPTATATIVGGGPDIDRLRKLAAPVQHAVTFTGPRPWDEIPKLLAQANIFVLPTRTRFGGIETEGLPLVYVEAAASGLPLIGGNAGGVKDAVRDGETGFLVDGRDPDETANAVNKLLDDPALAQKMGTAACRMAKEEFTWDAIFKQYEAALYGASAVD